MSRSLQRIRSAQPEGRDHVLRETLTMVLYLAIVLLSVHLARADDADKAEDLALIWGTAVGLGLAHLFAYDLTAVFAEGRVTGEDRLAAAGMTVAVVFTSAVASVPYLFTDDAADASSGSTLVLFALIALTAYSSVRRAGANRIRALSSTVLITALALVVVIIKYSLTH